MAGKTSFDSTGRWAQECGGSVSPIVFNRCFARMAAWLALVSQTIKTEFPEFELIHNLSAFSLSGPQKSAAETQRCLLRLSQMFDANSKQLYEQFQDLKPTAQRHRPVLSLFNGAYCLSCFACRFPMLCPGKQLSKSEELGDLQAWTLAESSVSGRCPDMSKTLARVLLASAAGTAQSERDFADIKYHTARDRAFLGPYFKAFERRLRQWDKNSLRGAVAMLAQKIWQEGFGSERSSGSARKPKFVSGLRLEASRQDAWRHIAFFNLPEFALHTLPAKARTRNPVSEAAWIARRRKSVKRCLKLNDAPRDMLRLSKSSRKAAGNAISTKREEATKKLSELKKRRCFQAQQDDLLLRQEQLRPAEHSQCLERRRKADHQAQLESSLRKRRRSQPELPALANMRLGV